MQLESQSDKMQEFYTRLWRGKGTNIYILLGMDGMHVIQTINNEDINIYDTYIYGRRIVHHGW
jgi:hypothetical protein